MPYFAFVTLMVNVGILVQVYFASALEDLGDGREGE